MRASFLTKDAAIPRLFGFFLFGAWAKLTFYAGGALSHAPWLGAGTI